MCGGIAYVTHQQVGLSLEVVSTKRYMVKTCLSASDPINFASADVISGGFEQFIVTAVVPTTNIQLTSNIAVYTACSGTCGSG